MGAKSEMKGPPPTNLERTATHRSQYECGPIQFAGTDSYERHLHP
jgi:hypothetical protein